MILNKFVLEKKTWNAKTAIVKSRKALLILLGATQTKSFTKAVVFVIILNLKRKRKQNDWQKLSENCFWNQKWVPFIMEKPRGDLNA
jgi:hypothetical protein